MRRTQTFATLLVAWLRSRSCLLVHLLVTLSVSTNWCCHGLNPQTQVGSTPRNSRVGADSRADGVVEVLAETDGSGKECPQTVVDAIESNESETLQELLRTGSAALQNCEVTGTALHQAAQFSSRGVVKALLENGFDPNAGTSKWSQASPWTWSLYSGPLMMAVAADNVEVVELLLRTPNIDVNLANMDGLTALIYGTIFDSAEALEVLLGKLGRDKGIDANLGDEPFRLTALIYAAQNNNVKALEVLLGKLGRESGIDLNRGDERGRTPLVYAINRGSIEALELLLGKLGLDSGLDVNLGDEDNRTALMYAAENDQVQALKALLKIGVDVNRRDKNGWTALMRAAKYKKAEATKVLLGELGIGQGIDVTISDADGQTALMIAAKFDSVQVLEVLLGHLGAKHSIDVNSADKGGKTALMHAAKHDNRQALETLLGHLGHINHIDVNLKDEDGKTALHFAANYNSLKALEVLLGKLGTESGIKVNIEDLDGQSALITATEKQFEEAGNLLCGDERVNQNKVLMYAARKNKAKVCRRLGSLTGCRSVNSNAMAPMPEGNRTALMVAAKEGYKEAASILSMGIDFSYTAVVAGLVNAVAGALPLYVASPRLVVFSLRLVPGVCYGVSLLVHAASSRQHVEMPIPETFVMVQTCLALAWTDLPGAIERAAEKMASVAEIELAVKETFAGNDKFAANKLILGRASSAAHGIEAALGLTAPQISAGLADPIRAMQDEIEETGDQNDLENFLYIVSGVSCREADLPSAVATSLKTGVYHGGSIGPHDFDTGHDGRSLEDWMSLDEVVLAHLSKAEFVAVRFYTSSSFSKINGPLRKEVSPHPWAMVVYLLDRGIKKLRAVQAQVNPEAFAGEMTLWRGMKNLEVDVHEFGKKGGTEMAPMSTTTNEDVARHYATSKVPLVFKYVVGGLKTGVSIQFLSLYPKEEEFLYTPLTFLSLKQHYEDDGTTILVVEPVMS